MLINLLLGISTMSICLTLQSVMVLAALRYYRSQQKLVRSASFMATNLPAVSLSAKRQEVDAAMSLVEKTTQPELLAREALAQLGVIMDQRV